MAGLGGARRGGARRGEASIKFKMGEHMKAKITRAPEKPNHNDAQKAKRELQKTVDSLTETLRDFQRAEDERAQIQREYLRAQSNIQENLAAVCEYSPVAGKVSIEWTETVLNECRRAVVTIPEDWDKPLVFVKGDEQLGHVTCDEARIKKDIQWVEKNPQCLVMLLGDAIDSATKESPGSVKENKPAEGTIGPSGPIRQAMAYVDMHRSIRDRIIGYVGGNHERRIDKALTEGGAGVRLIAEGLSTPDHRIPYSGGILLLDVRWRGHLWTFTLFHGAGAASTAGSRTQRLQRNMLLSDSLITLSGHLHDEMKTSRRFVRRAPDGKIEIAKQTALQCGTYLQYIGSYGEVGGMSPTGPDMIVIELLSDGRYIDRFKGESDS